MTILYTSAYLLKRFCNGLLLAVVVSVLMQMFVYYTDSALIFAASLCLPPSSDWHALRQVPLGTAFMFGTLYNPFLAGLPFPKLVDPFGRGDKSRGMILTRINRLGQRYPVERTGLVVGLLMIATASYVNCLLPGP